MAAPHEGARTVSRAVLLLAGPSAGLSIALAAQIAGLSWMLQALYGLQIDDIALVWAAGPLAGIIGQIAVGYLSDRTWLLGGRRRPYLVLSGLLSAAALLALPRLNAIGSALGGLSLVLVAGGVALMLDVAINVGLNPARALIADVTAEGRPRSVAFAWMQALSGLCGVLTNAAGAWLGHVRLLPYAAAATLLLTALPAFAVREPRRISTPPSATAGSTASGLVFSLLTPLAPAALLVFLLAAERTGLLHLPPLPLTIGAAVLTLLIAARQLAGRGTDPIRVGRGIILAQGLSWVGVFVLFVFLAPVAASLLPTLGTAAVGRTVAIGLGLFNSVAALAPVLILAPAIRRFRRAYVHAAALLVMAAAFTAIARAVGSPAALWAALAVAGVGWGAVVCLPYAMFCDRVDARRLGLMLGLFNLAVVIPQLTVSLGLGAIAPTLARPSDLFLIAAGALAAAAAAWARVPPIAAKETDR